MKTAAYSEQREKTGGHRRHFLLLALGIAAMTAFYFSPWFGPFVDWARAAGPLGALAGGLLYAFTLSTAAATVLLVEMAGEMPILAISFLAGAGAAAGDLLVYLWWRSEGGGEIRTRRRPASPVLRLGAIVGGALCIALPLPDELGVSLLGFSRISFWPFVALSFMLNSLGVLLLLLGAGWIF